MRMVNWGLMALLALAGGPVLAGDAAAGKDKFQMFCGSCHGNTGKGDGPASPALNPKPRNMADAAWQAGVDDDYLAKVIMQGGTSVGLSPMMTAFGQALSEQDLANIIAYIRTLDD